MDTKTKTAYRVAKTTGGEAEIHGIRPERFGTLEEAEAFVAAHRPGRYEHFYILAPSEVRPTIAKLKARNIEAFLQGHGYQIAEDFDDARLRLLKIAAVADHEWANASMPAPRKGWLKTETGIQYLYDCLHLLSEKKRVRYNNLTGEEMVRADEYRNGYHARNFREMLAAEFETEFHAKTVEMATASIHKDEY